MGIKTGDTLSVGFADNTNNNVITDKMIKDFLVNENLNANIDMLNLIIDSMFEYDIPNEDLKYFWVSEFEEILRTKGYCAIFRYKNNNDITDFNDKIICSTCSLTGELNPYGIVSNLSVITGNGVVKVYQDWISNNDVVLCGNNIDWLPDELQISTARILSECNISLRADVIGTRYNKIINARNNQEKENYIKAIEANESGKPQVIIGDITITDILSETGNDTTVVDLTSIKDSDKIQYISKLKDEELRQFISLYGLMTQCTTKLAQQTAEEVLAYLPLSMVIPLSRLNARKKAMEEVNKKFGKNWSVKFSKPWEIMYEKLLEIANIHTYNDDLDKNLDENLNKNINERGDSNDNTELD